MRILSALLISAAFLATPCIAQKNTHGPCSAATSQAQLNRCWANQADKAAQRLNAALDAALAKTTARDPVQAAQEKWKEYRDAECDAVAALYEGGSMQPMQRSACIVHLTNERIAELKNVVPQ
jgi:uncharacterized protein YecT (DUF1311 family)